MMMMVMMMMMMIDEDDDSDDSCGDDNDCIDSHILVSHLFYLILLLLFLYTYIYPSITIISYDKDYDHYLWGENGPWRKGFAGENNRRPDVLTIQFGMHSCWHANPQGLYSKHLKEINTSMIDSHIHAIPK